MTYRYTLLPSDEHVRVIRLEPSLDRDAPLRFTFFEDELDELEDTYEALSYTWGEAVFSCHITVSDSTGQYLRITKHLHAALVNFRDATKVRTIWADAVCIHQANSEEKAVQIPLMARIYQQASRVLVWLGEGDIDIETSIGLLSKMSRLGSSRFWEETDSQRRLVAVCQLCYFSRRWIIQELVLNPNIELWYGNARISWLRLNTTLRRGVHFASASGTHSSEVISKIYDLWRYWALEVPASNSAVANGKDLDMMDLLNTFQGSLCADERDIFFALGGLAKDTDLVMRPALSRSNSDAKFLPGIPIYVDYTVPCEEIFSNFATYAIARGQIEKVLKEACNRPRNTSQLAESSLPSWVPDWRLASYDACGSFCLRVVSAQYFRNSDTSQVKSSHKLVLDINFLVLGPGIVSASSIFPVFECAIFSAVQPPIREKQFGISDKTQIFIDRMISFRDSWRECSNCGNITNPVATILNAEHLSTPIYSLYVLLDFLISQEELSFTSSFSDCVNNALEDLAGYTLLFSQRPSLGCLSTVFGVTKAFVEMGDELVISGMQPYSKYPNNPSALVLRRQTGPDVFKLVGVADIIVHECSRQCCPLSQNHFMPCGFVTGALAYRERFHEGGNMTLVLE